MEIAPPVRRATRSNLDHASRANREGEVATSDRYTNELYWRVGIGSTILDEDATWNEDMCGTAGATVYTLTVSD